MVLSNKQRSQVAKKNQTGLIWIAIAAILWSAQGALGKTNTWNPVSLTAVRAIFASLTIGICRKDFRFPKGKSNYLAALFVALTGLLFIFANRLTTAANCIVLQYVMPVFVIGFSWAVWKQKPTKLDVTCCVFMLFGVSLCFLSGFSGGKLIGNLLALITACTFGGVYLCAKAKGSDVLGYTYLGAVFSVFLTPAVFFDSAFTLTAGNVLSAAAMGLCVGIGYVCFAKGFRNKVNPVSASMISYLEPVLNPVWVAIFIQEPVGVTSLIGIAIVLSMALIYSIFSKK